jgi:hypothetical protein
MKALVMDNFLEPLLAILAIVVPLGLAYVIVLLQSRKPACVCRKVSALTRDDPLQKRTGLSRAENKHAAR